MGAECPHNINDHESITAIGVLTTVAGSMGIAGVNDTFNATAEPLVAFGPEHAKTVAAEGYSKNDVKRFIFDHATLPLAKFSKENVERRLIATFGSKYQGAEPDTPVPMVQRPEDLVVIVVGGAGKHSVHIPTFGHSRSVTRPLKRRDGECAASVEEFRRT